MRTCFLKRCQFSFWTLALVLVTSLAPAQVQQTWVRRYVGPNRSDRPAAIQIDSIGAVYVTGSSATSNNYDFVTVKYAPDGTLLWTAQYNSGIGLSGDFPAALALDGAGNVYVLGTSDGESGPSRLTLVKYGPAGNQ